MNDVRLFKAIGNAIIISAIISIVGIFLSDMLWLAAKIQAEQQTTTFFSQMIGAYFSQEWWLYLVLLTATVITVVFLLLPNQKTESSEFTNKPQVIFLLSALLLPLVIAIPLQFINILIFTQSKATQFYELPLGLTASLNVIYFLVSASFIGAGMLIKTKQNLNTEWLIKVINAIGIGAVFVVCMQVFFTIWPYKSLSARAHLSGYQIMQLSGKNLIENYLKFIPIMLLLLFAGIFRQYIKRKQFDTDVGVDQTTGSFGTASWATRKDLEKLNAYDPNIGSMIGKDYKGNTLYLPLYNKLTIAPPGSWKTSASSIPVLLTYKGPIFATDFKSGELWAVAARYRTEVLGRVVVLIDPYGVTKIFRAGKPESLLFEYHINPFDFIPEDELQRDRMINAFAASFVINEQSSHAQHFDDNARILIRGFIDYMMKTLPKEARTLATLYQLLSEHQNQAKMTFDSMSALSGRAAAASNQVSRVGDNERGSILSTSYRQIDWMSDKNMQHILSESNFDLRDFLKGNMDIFVVLPEEQVHEQSRLVRMIMALLKAIITQADPNELPKNKMLFLLEELAQLGYCPDVEQFVEVMRARGVVVWTVFQSLSQIEMFKKPDLFKGATLKQIFTLDDTATMEWIQKLGGKRTVVTKTVSSNTGDSRQKMQVFGGTVSKGEGESVHETGADLIQINEIREMPLDEQLIFLHGSKPIKCKKVRYFENSFFEGKYDINPLENRG